MNVNLSRIDESKEEPVPIYTWDISNPRAIINLVPEQIKQAMLELAEAKPELTQMDEGILLATLRGEKILENNKHIVKGPTATDNRIRLAFWYEYEYAQATNKKMRLYGITGTTTTVEYFLKVYLKNPYKVAWMICPPLSYVTRATETMMYLLDELREIVNIPHMVGGKPDHKIIQAKITIFKMLDDRIRGAATQKVEIQQKSMNINFESNDRSVIGKMLHESREEQVDRQLRAIEARELDLAPIPVQTERVGE